MLAAERWQSINKRPRVFGLIQVVAQMVLILSAEIFRLAARGLDLRSERFEFWPQIDAAAFRGPPSRQCGGLRSAVRLFPTQLAPSSLQRGQALRQRGMLFLKTRNFSTCRQSRIDKFMVPFWAALVQFAALFPARNRSP